MILHIRYFSIILGLVILLPSIGSSQSQVSGNYEFKPNSEGCLILLKKGISLDTLCLNTYKGFSFKRNQILEVVKDRVIKIEFGVKGTDSFNNNFYIVQEWNIENDKFLLLNSTKIPLKDCQVKRLKFNLGTNGINWSYRYGLLKKEKGMIPFIELKETRIYNLSCCK